MYLYSNPSVLARNTLLVTVQTGVAL